MKRVATCALACALLAHTAHAAQGGASLAGDPSTMAFKAWDTDGDGTLSQAEFRAGVEQAQAVARARAALSRRFAAGDANHDRAIDAVEYAGLVLVRQAGSHAPPLSRFDADGDGSLAFAEYMRMVEALAPRPTADAGPRR